MARFTVRNLRESLEEINEGLAEAGADVRFGLFPRNNYQAVDEYEVDSEGNRTGSGCRRNVGCGTSKEVNGYCWDAYYAIINRMNREEKDAEIKRLKAENEKLREQIK